MAMLAGPHSVWAGQRRFVGIKEVCQQSRDQKERFWGEFAVPTLEGMDAYVMRGEYDTFDEHMCICEVGHDKFREVEAKNINDGLELRRLHVPRGGSPTTYQKEALKTLMREGLGISWLGSPLVSTIIHELSHSRSFTAAGRELGKPQSFRYPSCMLTHLR